VDVSQIAERQARCNIQQHQIGSLARLRRRCNRGGGKAGGYLKATLLKNMLKPE
jgi:hypothetical protein